MESVPYPSNTTSGNVNTSPRRGRPAKKAEVSTVTEVPLTPDTFAMVTDDTKTTNENPKSSISVPDITNRGWLSTVLIETPIHYLDAGLPPLTEAQLQELSPECLQSLTSWAEARGESLQDSINAIVSFYVDEQDDRAGYPLKDAIEFFVTNYIAG